ncbi:MAG: hypothetical protein P8J45_04845 [Phycisphaerales bacterium]|jgi:hypothetical protein|nr:hypothetical protein [Phycisphaerales bacterium]
MSPKAVLFATAPIALLAMQVGCSAPSPTRGGFASPAPAARTYAIEQTVLNAHQSGTLDRDDLKSMVELLLADDDLVRFMAIAGLEDLTGETFGFQFFDPPEVRYKSVLEWRDYVVTVKSAKGLQIEPPPTATAVKGEQVSSEGEKG